MDFCVTLLAVVILLAAAAAGYWSAYREQFSFAAAMGDLPALERMLRAKPARARDREALFQASVNGGVETVRLLVGHGACVSDRLFWGGAALHTAAVLGRIETMAVILAHGAEVNQDRDGTPLAWAARGGSMEAVEFLLAHGADPARVPLDEVGRRPFKGLYVTAAEYDAIRDRIRSVRE